MEERGSCLRIRTIPNCSAYSSHFSQLLLMRAEWRGVSIGAPSVRSGEDTAFPQLALQSFRSWPQLLCECSAYSSHFSPLKSIRAEGRGGWRGDFGAGAIGAGDATLYLDTPKAEAKAARPLHLDSAPVAGPAPNIGASSPPRPVASPEVCFCQD